MLKTHARYQRLRVYRLIWLLVLLLWIAAEAFIAFAFFTIIRADALSWEIYATTIVVLGGCVIGFFVWTLLRLRSWKRFEESRKAAAQGQLSLMAADQPIPDPSALPLPSTIIHQPGRFPFLRCGIIVAVACLMWVEMFTNSPSGSTTASSTDYFITTSIPALAIAVMIMLYLGYNVYIHMREYRHIVVASDGLHVSGRLTSSRFIAWKDVKLVALVSLYRNEFRQPRYQVEVSSEREVVYWSLPQQSLSRSSYFNDPSPAAKAYRQQVDGALSVITGMTGLPLYDLRPKR
jgi:hypothetical protein